MICGLRQNGALTTTPCTVRLQHRDHFKHALGNDKIAAFLNMQDHAGWLPQLRSKLDKDIALAEQLTQQSDQRTKHVDERCNTKQVGANVLIPLAHLRAHPTGRTCSAKRKQ